MSRNARRARLLRRPSLTWASLAQVIRETQGAETPQLLALFGDNISYKPGGQATGLGHGSPKAAPQASAAAAAQVHQCASKERLSTRCPGSRSLACARGRLSGQHAQFGALLTWLLSDHEPARSYSFLTLPQFYPQTPAGGLNHQLVRPSSAPSVGDAGSTSPGPSGSPSPGSPVKLPAGRPASLGNLTTAALGRPGSPGPSLLARSGSAGSSSTSAAVPGPREALTTEPVAVLRTDPPPATASAAVVPEEAAAIEAPPALSSAKTDSLAGVTGDAGGSAGSECVGAPDAAVAAAPSNGSGAAAGPAESAQDAALPGSGLAAAPAAASLTVQDSDSSAAAASGAMPPTNLTSDSNSHTAATSAEETDDRADLQPTSLVTQPAEVPASSAESISAGLVSPEQGSVGGRELLAPAVAAASDQQSGVHGAEGQPVSRAAFDAERSTDEGVSADIASPPVGTSGNLAADVRSAVQTARTQLLPVMPVTEAVTADVASASTEAEGSPAIADSAAAEMVSTSLPEAEAQPSADTNGGDLHDGMLAAEPVDALTSVPTAQLGAAAAQLVAAEPKKPPSSALNGPSTAPEAAVAANLLDGVLRC